MLINQNDPSMKSLSTFLAMLIFLAFAGSVQSQNSSRNDDCTQLMKVIKDAMNNFEEYKGEEIYDDIDESGYEYDIILFDDDGSGLYTIYDMTEYSWVEFYYPYTYELSEAKAKFSQLLSSLDGCLSGSYFKSKDEDNYSILYQEYTDNRDAGKTTNPSFPQIEISIEQKKDSYYVMIAIYAP